ncbi:hypothetical protein SeMB42_g03677 [Synchytrium endobioticum]|uniref:Uncharacterized protein n=1 Tax=Synchytrium endobioticum TaxID=286115 RepID=A0A507D4L0_9FUNG|nr:hypothetical protein SeLEV6574_g04003 [Synchytrium endobioticum]TPX46449.1 hypothetical protein SeMB42_g03677 [Synchytrium endobioticum]
MAPNNPPLAHGLLGSVIYDQDASSPWSFQAAASSSIPSRHAKGLWRPASHLMQLTPKSSLDKEYPPVALDEHGNLSSGVEVDRAISSSLDYLNGMYPELYIPRDILRQVIKDNLKDELTRSYHLHGNCVAVCDDALMYVGGGCMNELYWYPFEVARSQRLPCKFPVRARKSLFNFKAPIAQIISSFTGITAVRTHSSVSFLKTVKPRRYYHAGSLPFATDQPLHIAWNRIVPGLAAVLVQGGYLTLWDDGAPSTCETICKPGNNNVTWTCCEFGPHPKTIMLSSKEKISMLDLRAGHSRPESLLEEENILGFTASTCSPFLLGFTTDSKISIYDHRYMKEPLVQWLHFYNNDVPFHLQFVERPHDCLLTVGYRSNAIVAYTTTTVQPYKEPSPPFRVQPFSRHPYAFSDLPVGSAPLVSQSKTNPLLGYSIWSNDDLNGSLGIVQLAANGAIYMQQYRNDDTPNWAESDMMSAEHENILVEELERAIYQAEKEMVLAEQGRHKHLLRDRMESNMSTLHQWVQDGFQVSERSMPVVLDHPDSTPRTLYDLVYPKPNRQNTKMPVHSTSHVPRQSMDTDNLNKFKALEIDLRAFQMGDATDARSLLKAVWPNPGGDVQHYEKSLDWAEADVTLSSRMYTPTGAETRGTAEPSTSRRTTASQPRPFELSRTAKMLAELWSKDDYGDKLPPISRMHQDSVSARPYLDRKKVYRFECRDSSTAEPALSNAGMDNDADGDISSQQPCLEVTAPPPLSQSSIAAAAVLMKAPAATSQSQGVITQSFGTPITNSQMSTPSQSTKKKRKAGF